MLRTSSIFTSGFNITHLVIKQSRSCFDTEVNDGTNPSSSTVVEEHERNESQ
jgi:hypothetical protein